MPVADSPPTRPASVSAPASAAALAELARQVVDAPGLPTLVVRLARSLDALLDFDQVVLLLRGAEGRSWGLLRGRQSSGPVPGWIELPDADSPLARSMARQVLVRESAPGAALLPPGDDGADGLADVSSFASALCVPLLGASGVLGALGLFSVRPEAFGPADEPLMRLLGTLTEATARRLVLQDELARAEAPRAERLQGDGWDRLLAELRRPVSAMELGLELAGPVPGADAIREGVHALRDHLLQLTDIGRLEEGRVVPRRDLVPVDAFLRQAVGRFAAGARQAEVQLSARCEPESASAPFDARLMGAVLDVLLDQALRAAPRRGQVTAVGRLSAGTLTLAVADTGPAWPTDWSERAFTKQALAPPAGHTRPMPGLGLYFCRLVVARHGGSITVEPTPVGGALFRISLPA